MILYMMICPLDRTETYPYPHHTNLVVIFSTGASKYFEYIVTVHLVQVLRKVMLYSYSRDCFLWLLLPVPVPVPVSVFFAPPAREGSGTSISTWYFFNCSVSIHTGFRVQG
jgi:hypothetical protein